MRKITTFSGAGLGLLGLLAPLGPVVMSVSRRPEDREPIPGGVIHHDPSAEERAVYVDEPRPRPERPWTPDKHRQLSAAEAKRERRRARRLTERS